VAAARQGGPPEGATVAVGAVVVDSAGHVLLVRRARPPLLGAWTLPGGRVEPGESLSAAIVREVAEETALAARVVCGLGVAAVSGEGYAYAIHEYLLVPIGDTSMLRAADDAADARWVGEGDFTSLGVALAAIEVIERGLLEARARGLLMTTAASK
jgi:ADP-ribose pyrophosphatase YjhB (NUDIX family)